jgi:hypothetical protein
MSNTASLLPAGFKALEPFVASWATFGTAGRAQRRNESTASERSAFYEAAKDLAPDALALLDQKPLEAFDEREERLMNLMLSLAHVSLAVESQGSDEERHAEYRQYMRIIRSSADASPTY